MGLLYLLSFGSKIVMSFKIITLSLRPSVACSVVSEQRVLCICICLDLNDYQRQFDQLIHLHLFLYFSLTQWSS